MQRVDTIAGIGHNVPTFNQYSIGVNMELSTNAKNFLSRNPTLIGIVAGYKFYEHPTHGDDSPLVCITPEGKKKRTDFFELPEMEEVLNYF